MAAAYAKINPTFYSLAKPAFGQLRESGDASDFTSKKKIKLLHKQLFESVSVGSYDKFFSLKRSRLLVDLECCGNVYPFNTFNLVSNLFSYEDLQGINVIGKIKNEDICQDIVTYVSPSDKTVPFYYNYYIDPCGELFGRSPCGLKNYLAYRCIDNPLSLAKTNTFCCFCDVCCDSEECCDDCCDNNCQDICYECDMGCDECDMDCETLYYPECDC
jgi:hypothetical protein